MKTLFAIWLAAGVVGLPAEGYGDYEVHEWGTLTQVSGADGIPLPWYQPQSDLASLPAFVGSNPFRSKIQPNFILRMETPVLYFYPKAPLTVTAKVSFDKGSITEWYPLPEAFTFPALAPPGQSLPAAPFVEWKAELVAPEDSAAAAQIPAVNSAQGEHYAHAREVPDAWIVRARHPTLGAHADKFIFYRGAAEFAIPIVARALSESELSIQNHLPHALTAAFALRVGNGLASWTRLPALNSSSKTPTPEPTRIAVRPTDQPLDEAAAALGTAMKTALVEAGLSTAEAAAMVATWQDSWFREPGTRILCLLPKDYIDRILPLQLTPAPRKVTRVFVSRLEIFTPAREQALAALLDLPLPHPPDQRYADLAHRSQKFQALELGRFGAAGLERAFALKRNAMKSTFLDLAAEASKAKKNTASTEMNAVSAR